MSAYRTPGVPGESVEELPNLVSIVVEAEPYGSCYVSRRLHPEHARYHLFNGVSFCCPLCDADAGCCKHGAPWSGKCEACADEVIAAIAALKEAR